MIHARVGSGPAPPTLLLAPPVKQFIVRAVDPSAQVFMHVCGGTFFVNGDRTIGFLGQALVGCFLLQAQHWYIQTVGVTQP